MRQIGETARSSKEVLASGAAFGLAQLADQSAPGPLQTAATAYQNAIDKPHQRNRASQMTATNAPPHEA